MSALVGNVLVFGRLLRALGLEVHVGRLLDVIEALPHVDLGRREALYHTCRTLLVHRRGDLAIFDRAFEAFWRDAHPAAPRRDPPPDAVAAGAPPARPTAGEAAEAGAAEDAPSDRSAREGIALVRTWSDADVLAHKDFAAFSDEEVAAARDALRRLRWTPGERRTRRWVPGRGPRLDVRRALAQSVRTGGDVLRWPRRRRGTRARPVVVLCDISGSMARYSRMLLFFAHAFAARERRVETFVFSTRLSRVTAHLRARSVDEALAHVARSVPDWSGGTRIGDALGQLRRRWSRRLPRGGLVVLLVSDGWDRGAPEALRDQMAWLRRRCHRLIWLNPLIGTADYEPLTRGLRAALPFVDDFLPVRTLANLEDLALHLNGLPDRVRHEWRLPAATASLLPWIASGHS